VTVLNASGVALGVGETECEVGEALAVWGDSDQVVWDEEPDGDILGVSVGVSVMLDGEVRESERDMEDNEGLAGVGDGVCESGLNVWVCDPGGLTVDEKVADDVSVGVGDGWCVNVWVNVPGERDGVEVLCGVELQVGLHPGLCDGRLGVSDVVAESVRVSVNEC
jgi:hypothetical protein